MLLVTEVFRHGKPRLRYTHTGSRRLIHLTEYHTSLVNNSGFFHFIVKVITFSGTLTNSGKYRVTTMLCRNIVDQLLDQYRFTYTGTTKQTCFSTLLIWAEQVYDLDTCL